MRMPSLLAAVMAAFILLTLPSPALAQKLSAAASARIDDAVGDAARAAAQAADLTREENAAKTGWLLIDFASSGTVVYMRYSAVGSASSEERYAKVWIKLDHELDPSMKDRTTLTLLTINCKDWTFRELQSTGYRPDGSTHPNRIGYTNDYIAPDSVINDIAEKTCGRPAD